jgi:hypothetical protein
MRQRDAMSHRGKILVAIGALATLAGEGLADPAMPSGAVRFAIVIGNNAPQRPGAIALHFGDDDALATHRLLGEAGVHSVLLARFDEATERLHPDARSDGLPRWPDLDAAFDRVAGEMRRERALGREAELLLFYSGHGDVKHGEGYVLLEDRHLTRSALAALLARLPANRSHVIIDACKSYFMAFEKGPGGHRVPFSGGFIEPRAAGVANLANTGFLLSTSSDRDSHEWDRFGGGVFSHAVRSALRGAADLNRDRRISYAEMGAFLATATQAIANPRLRPDFLIRPPAGRSLDLSATLLQWDGRISNAVLLDRPVGHVYIEASNGERVLDVHVTSNEQVSLRIPKERPLFVRRESDVRGEYVIRVPGLVRVSDLAERPLSIRRRGAEFLAFEQLFSIPFGRDSVRRYAESWARGPLLTQRSREDLLAVDDQQVAEVGARVIADDTVRRSRLSTVQTTAGTTALITGVLAVGALAFLSLRDSNPTAFDTVRTRPNETPIAIGAIVAASLSFTSGAIWLYARLRLKSAKGTRLGVLPFAGDAPGAVVAIDRLW